MKYLFAFALLLAVIGCGSSSSAPSHEGTMADTHSDVKNASSDPAGMRGSQSAMPQTTPGGVGLTAGGTGTGTTNGGSTGY